MSSTTCPVFRPSLEEFCNFSRYIDKIEKSIGDAGICKVIPPDGWREHKSDADLEKIYKRHNVKIGPIKQCVNGLRGVYQLGLLEAKKMSVDEFRTMAAKDEPDSELSYEEVERAFWRSMGPLTPAPLYGADLQYSLFEDEEASGWNLSKLDNMIKLLPGNVPGITTAMLYFGMWRAMFAFHTEDMNLYSINYLHTGKPKSWYSIPPNHAKRFGSMAQSLHPQGFTACSEYLRHKTSMFSPKVLKEYGIPFHTVVQLPGEFVITFPASYHAGFNHGFNCAEATNFTTERWFPKGLEAKACRCQPYSVHINVKDFMERVEAKKQHDITLIETVTNPARRKKMLQRLSYTGWIEWQQRLAQEARDNESKAQAEKHRLMEERRKKRDTLRKEAMQHGRAGLKRRLPSEGEGSGEAALELMGWENEDEDVGTDWTSTAWEFRCHCGVRCANTDVAELWPQGAMFQCVGCDMWAHTQCIYSADQPPQEQPFCHVCLASMLRIQTTDAVKKEAGTPGPSNQPFHTGKRIGPKSRVLVCQSKWGLCEGHVKDTGEGKARVAWKARLRGPYGGGDEWIDLSSPRFLSNQDVSRALLLMRPLQPITPDDAGVCMPNGGTHRTNLGKKRRSAAGRGLPMPSGTQAVSYAKFMKERKVSQRQVQQAMLAPGGYSPAPGTYYPRYARPGQVFSYHSEDEGDEEEEAHVMHCWERKMAREQQRTGGPNGPAPGPTPSQTITAPRPQPVHIKSEDGTPHPAPQHQHMQRYALAAAAASASWAPTVIPPPRPGPPPMLVPPYPGYNAYNAYIKPEPGTTSSTSGPANGRARVPPPPPTPPPFYTPYGYGYGYHPYFYQQHWAHTRPTTNTPASSASSSSSSTSAATTSASAPSSTGQASPLLSDASSSSTGGGNNSSNSSSSSTGAHVTVPLPRTQIEEDMTQLKCLGHLQEAAAQHAQYQHYVQQYNYHQYQHPMYKPPETQTQQAKPPVT